MTLLLECKFGSQVYGTALPTSDIDVGKVILEPKKFIFGIQNLSVKSNTIEQTAEGETDTRTMYLRRFVKLCANGNPNVLEWLYTPKDHIDYMHPLFKDFIYQNRAILLNKKKLIASHLGFAKSQVHKMRSHEKEMGAKRKLLYEKFGYDVKYASHALRLIWQLQDILLNGFIVLPYHPDRVKILKAIKQGQWTLAQFDDAYNNAVEDASLTIESIQGNLPESTDYNGIAEILESFYIEAYYGDNAPVV